MTSVNFRKFFAKHAEMSQEKSGRVLDLLDGAIKAYLAQIEAGEKVKVCDIILEKYVAPARSGDINGVEWESKEHNAVKVKTTKALKDSVLD